jgi:hypothetical protein
MMIQILSRFKKINLRGSAFLFFILLGLYAQSQTTWYVNDNSSTGDVYATAIGNDANAGNIPSAPKLSLSAAFNAAAAGDIIYVDKGTFTGANNRNLILNKSISIIGAGTGNTIFTSHSDHRFATIAANNITIQNLQLFDFFLGSAVGQVLLVNTNVKGFNLKSVVMKKNYGATSNGESIYLSSGSNSTFDGLFFSCSGFNGDSGGAIKVNSCNLTVKNSFFSQSRDSDGKGGAIEINGATSIVNIDKTSFEGNSARAGGAIAQIAGNLTVTNSCFNRNYIQGDASSATNGGGHYFSQGNDANLKATFVNCKFDGAFFCGTNNPTGYTCQFSSNASNDGNAISIRGAAGTYSFETCSFNNSNQPASNFDRGLDLYLQSNGAISVTVNNCNFGNDMGTTNGKNIWNSGLTSSQLVVTNSGTKQTTPNTDGISGNNYSYSGTVPGGNNLTATSSTSVVCSGQIAGCSISVNCSNETNAPIIATCASNQTITSCSGVLPDYRSQLSVFDDCSFTISQSPAPGTLLSSLGNGNHTVTFTVSDQSPNSPDALCSMVLTLVGCYTCNPTLVYPITSVCQAGIDVTPVFSPVGGTFSSTSGLALNATTGQIDASGSTAGIYTVTYSPNSSYPSCMVTRVFTVLENPIATISSGTIACHGATTDATLTVTNGTAPYSISPSSIGLYAGIHTFTVTDANGCDVIKTLTLDEPETFTTSILSSKGTSFCFGESTTLTATGGSTYLWSNGANTQTTVANVSGNYSLTAVNENGCEANSFVTINANYCTPVCPSTNNLLQNGSFENPSRNGYYSHEQMPYWTNAADGNKVDIVGPNLYCVGCWPSATDGIQYVEINGNTAGNIHQDVTVLPNKTLELSFKYRARENIVGIEKLRVTLSDPTNNSNVYTFDATAVFGVWKKITGAYVTGPTQTSVRVRLQVISSRYPGHGNFVDNVILNYLDCGPNAVAVLGDHYICNSSLASVLSVTNTTNAVSYLWSNGATTPTISVNAPGNYFVKVIFANGTTNISSPFTVYDFATYAIINGSATFCTGASNMLTAIGGTSYLWNNGATTASINVTSSGTYSVAISNANGCNIVKELTVNSYTCAISYCPTSTNLLLNGSFENPALIPSWNTVSVPNWTNLVDGNKIEIHKNVLGISIPNGSQYIELNGSTYGKIYQDVNVVSGKTLQLSFMYRGRTSANESFRVTLYNPLTSTNIFSYTTTATHNVWKKNVANYVCDSTQAIVRVKFEGLTGFNPAYGNLIDDIALNYYDCANASAVIIGNDEICYGSSTTLSLLNNANISSYLWSNGSTNSIISVNMPGIYTVTVTLNNSTTLASSSFVVSDCAYSSFRSANQNKQHSMKDFDVVLYPNPTVEAFNITIFSDNDEEVVVEIYDMLGHLVESKSVHKADISNVTIGSKLPSNAIYHVVVKQGINTKSKRLIKY